MFVKRVALDCLHKKWHGSNADAECIPVIEDERSTDAIFRRGEGGMTLVGSAFRLARRSATMHHCCDG